MYQSQKEKYTYFLYARKSSESEDRQVQSIDDQISRLKQLAHSQHFTIKEIFTEAKTAKMPYCRPVFDAMLKRIEKGEADGILCWQINRLSRNPIDSGTISWMLQKNILKSIQTIDKEYLPDDNVLLFNVESGMANQYIIDLRKNSRRGMEGKAERGWLPSQPPLGYVNDKSNHTIVTDPERFELVRRMWELMLTGNYTVGEIRKIITDEWGFRAPKSSKSAVSMPNSFMYKMFSNIFYTGMFDWAGKRYNGNHTPMISLTEFDRVQLLLGRNGRPRSQTHSFAYTGLIRCAVCGSMYTATEKRKYVKSKKEFKNYTYYHCTKKKKEITCIGQKPLTEALLESYIETKLFTYAIHPVFREWAIEHLQGEREKEKSETVLKTSNQETLVQETEKELLTLTRMRIKEQIDDATFNQEKERLQKALMNLKWQAVEGKNTPTKYIDLTEKTFDFAFYAYKTLRTTEDLHVKKDIVSFIGSNFLIKDKNLLFDTPKCLVPIEKGYPSLFEEYSRLELEKMVDVERQNAIMNSIFLRWLSLAEREL